MNIKLKEDTYNYISSKNEILRYVGLTLWNHPELGLEEIFAHQLITDVFEKEGFLVTKKFILDTGFKAEYQTSDKPHIVYFCEYDALPIIGHACGHNLIAAAGIGAAFGLKYAMEHHNIKCKLTVFGSPAEENAGGKLAIINSKVLDTVDVAMMVHPREINSLHMPHCALKDLTITFKGCSAHASASPWEGKNALDAAVLAYQGIAHYRKHMIPHCQINANIKMNSQSHLGLIPDNAIMEADIRAPSMDLLVELERRVNQIVKGASLMADCKVLVEIEAYDEIYANLVSNKPLLKAYNRNASDFGIKFTNTTRIGGSTDMGNVSQIIPSIHPVYFIGSKEGPHTEEFVKWTGTEESHNLTIIQAKILAATGIDLATNISLVEEAREDFNNSKQMKFTDINYSELYK